MAVRQPRESRLGPSWLAAQVPVRPRAQHQMPSSIIGDVLINILRAKAALRIPLAILLAPAMVMIAGCGSSQPKPVSTAELASAKSFPYYTLYWVGRSFDHQPLTGVDGIEGYKPAAGDSVYYGDCVSGNGILGSNGCLLPLKVTTSVYALHRNVDLGAAENTIIRGVPAAIFDKGRSIEIYTSRLTIDLYASSRRRALQAASMLRPLNASGSSAGPLPPPVYCPELTGRRSPTLFALMQSLKGEPCEYAKRAFGQEEALKR
jgi:hypothetical protein